MGDVMRTRLLVRALMLAILMAVLSAVPAHALAPPNDAFQDGAVLGTEGGAVLGTNVDATAENILGTMGPEPELVWIGGEPEAWYQDSHTVWYQWTALASTEVNFRLHTDVAFDRPDLKAYTGTVDYDHMTPNGYGGFAPAFDLHRVGSGSPQWAHPQDVTFGATAGTTYYLQVRGGESQSGAFSIDYPSGDGHAPVRLAYIAGPHGAISAGPATQTIGYGTSAATVTASPDAGYHFLKWEDEVAANPRIDTKVTADATHTALFAANTYTVSTTTRLAGRSTSRLRKRYWLTGVVSPAVRGKVTIRLTRLVRKKYRHAGTVRVNVTNGRFAYSFRPKRRGRWHVVASYLGGVAGAVTYRASRSRTKTLRVK